MSYWEDRDNEKALRNAAAIRTALMLGAEFVLGPMGWSVKGVDLISHNKTMPAWCFIATHGICITKDGRACKCSEIHHEDLT